ncbi:MAG: hypothetical protein ABWX94_00880 [Candidatus Saccharimonadales bacterium]
MMSDQNGQKVPSGNIEGLSGLLSAVLTQTSVIQVTDNALDGKAHNLMAAALVVVTFLGTQLTDDHGWRIWVIAAMFIQAFTVYLIIYLTRSRRYTGSVVDLGSHREYFAKDSELLLVQLIEDADSANDANTIIIESKGRLLSRAVSVFLVGFAVGIISLFVVQ